MTKILARLLFCPERYVGNVLIHMPIGWLIVASALLLPPHISVIIAVYFLCYEWIEQCDLKDKAYQDLKGAMWGIGEVAVPLMIVRLINGV